MALEISLGEGERIIVNGAVLRAKARLRLAVENQVAILRGRDVMTPEEADTPGKRLYYTCMLAYIDEAHVEQHREDLATFLTDFVGALESLEAKATCARIASFAASSNFYRALMECRNIIRYEAEAFNRLEAVSA